MRAADLKRRLADGGAAFGTFVKSADPAVPEVLALTGLDFAILDAEHSPLDVGALSGLIRAADGAGLPAIVRVSENARHPIMQALDVGASGVMAPQVDSAREAAELVAAAKYHPLGSRGLATTHRAARHGFADPVAYPGEANASTLVISYVETRAAVEAVEDMAAVDGIDVLFAGPFDLSQSYGVPGQPAHADVQAAMDRVAAACREAGRVAGTIAAGAEQARALVDRGFRFLACGSDLGLMAQAAQAVLRGIRG